MKSTFVILCIALSLSALSISAQSIKASVSSDSILLGNTIKVTFKIENTEAELETPSFENMTIVGGPNYSNSVQIMNGHKSSSQSVSYYLKPEVEGQLFIPPVTITDGNQILETLAIEINIYPNPDGIINNIEPEGSFFFESMDFPFQGFDNSDFFKSPFDDLKLQKEESPKEESLPKSKSIQKTRKI